MQTNFIERNMGQIESSIEGLKGNPAAISSFAAIAGSMVI